MAFRVNHCCAIILAAGQSRRLGSPKQLLEYRGKTLLQQTIDEVRSTGMSTILVLGANADLILTKTDTKGTHIVHNDNWNKGMASSVHAGITALQEINSEADGAIIMVSDQPFVNSAILNDMVSEQNATGKPMIACEYEGSIGVPALFHRDFFAQLLQLYGDAGAKKIMQQNSAQVATVKFPLGSIDIDTMEAYQNLK